jgi:hypothetical protein
VFPFAVGFIWWFCFMYCFYTFFIIIVKNICVYVFPVGIVADMFPFWFCFAKNIYFFSFLILQAVAFMSDVVLTGDSYKKKQQFMKENSANLAKLESMQAEAAEGGAGGSGGKSSSSSNGNVTGKKRSRDELALVEEEVKKAAKAMGLVSASEAATSLIDLALADGSTDNISAIVVKYV